MRAKCRVFGCVCKNFENGQLTALCLSIRSSVSLSAWNNAAPIGRISMKFDILLFSENLSRKFVFQYYMTQIRGTSHEDQYTFLITSHSVLLRMRNVSQKICRDNQNTYSMFGKFFPKIVPLMT